MKILELWEEVRANRAKQVQIISEAADLGWNEKREDDFIALGTAEKILINTIHYA